MKEKEKEKENTLAAAESRTINQLVSDPSEVPDLINFVGRVGRSTEAGYFRLYTDPEELRVYLEIREADVVLHQPALDEPESTIIWIKASSPVRLVRVRAGREIIQRTKRLKLNSETLRALTTATPSTANDRQMNTRGLCTSADSCSLAPCCGGYSDLCA